MDRSDSIIETFGEALQKLKEAYEHEVEGWQDKMLTLTNQKTASAKRIDELYSRNQQLREQQRSLTENIKQLENRLRAGLCDRCTVTQDVANRRQQEYETSQLKSIQHISALAKEMGSLKRENKRLSEEVKSLHATLRNHNGYSTETASPEMQQSRTQCSPLSLLLSTSQKSAALPAGGAVLGSCEARLNEPNMTDESRPVDIISQQQSYPSPLTAAWKTIQDIGQDRPASERIVRSTDAPDASALPPYPASSTASAVKWRPSKVHAPVPFRPQPVKSHKFAQSWHLPNNPDWVTMSIMGEEGMVIHHNPNMMHLPAKIHNTPSQNAQERVLNAHILWANMNPAMRCSSGPQTSLSEAGENLGGTMRPRLTSMSEPNQSWETVVTKDNVPDKAVDDDGPLDLSESGRAKAVKNLEKTPDSVVSIADLLRSTSSSSPPAPSSSSVGSSGSQSEQRLGELTWQEKQQQNLVHHRKTSKSSANRLNRARTITLKEDAEEVVQAAEKNKADDTMSLTIGTERVSACPLSLQPVVVLKNMKRSLSGQNPADSQVTLQEKEKEECDQEEKEEKRNQPRKRMRLERELETDTNSQSSGLMETRTRMGGRSKEKGPAEQG